jgi:hypothetical protein
MVVKRGVAVTAANAALAGHNFQRMAAF